MTIFIVAIILLILGGLSSALIWELRKARPPLFRPVKPKRKTNAKAQTQAASPLKPTKVFKSPQVRKGPLCTITGLLRVECDCEECQLPQ